MPESSHLLPISSINYTPKQTNIAKQKRSTLAGNPALILSLDFFGGNAMFCQKSQGGKLGEVFGNGPPLFSTDNPRRLAHLEVWPEKQTDDAIDTRGAICKKKNGPFVCRVYLKKPLPLCISKI